MNNNSCVSIYDRKMITVKINDYEIVSIIMHLIVLLSPKTLL